MKNKKYKLLIIILLVITMSGCTKIMKNKDGKAVINPKTGQTLTKNVICQPSDQETLRLYEQNNVKIDKLPTCKAFNPFKQKYEGLWMSFFVSPLSWLIINLGKLLRNNGLGLIVATLVVRGLMIPFTLKSQRNAKVLQDLQPAFQKIEKKYEGKTDSQSMTKKGTEMAMLYQKHNINPLSSILTPILQIVILFAFLEAVQRVPAIFEGKFLMYNMGTTPLTALQNKHFSYILLTLLNVGITYLSFKNMPAITEEKSKFSMKNVMIFLIGFTSLITPVALNLYWIIGSLMGLIQQKHLEKVR